jgi:nicotinamide riboside transporter PnuC
MIGQIGVTKQKTWGLVIWILSNFVWIYVDIWVHTDYPQALQYGYYLIMNTVTIFVWRKNDAKLQSASSEVTSSE